VSAFAVVAAAPDVVDWFGGFGTGDEVVVDCWAEEGEGA